VNEQWPDTETHRLFKGIRYSFLIEAVLFGVPAVLVYVFAFGGIW
jgi:hypothetical protein